VGKDDDVKYNLAPQSFYLPQIFFQLDNPCYNVGPFIRLTKVILGNKWKATKGNEEKGKARKRRECLK
jgi:hypothetical protein